MSDEKQIDESDVQQDSPAEAMSEVTDPDGQVDDDIMANRVIAVAPAGAASGPGVVVVEDEE
jgi:hypothetical protein